MDAYSLSSHIMVFFSLYFEVFFLVSFIGKKKEGEAKDPDFTPPVSIIIPCFNEEKSVVGTINSVLALDYPKENIQIIFVDDGSTDKTLEVVKAAFGSNPQVEIYHKENGGKYTALNFGLEKVRHAFVGSLDADSFVDSKSLRRIMDKFQDESVMATIPATVIHNPKTIIQKAQRAEYNYGIFIVHSLSILGSLFVTPGPFSFFRREVFAKIGKYRHAYGTEDMEIAMRMQKHGLRIVHAHRAIIYTLGPNTARKLYKQRVRWAGGLIGNLKDYRHMFFNKKYGNLSMLVLPFISIATIGLLFFSMVTIWRLGKSLYAYIERLSIVGLSFEKFNFLDLFYFSADSLSILALFLLFYAMLAMCIGNKLATGKARFNFEFFYMFFLYSIMYPFWIMKAAYNTLTAKTAPWR